MADIRSGLKRTGVFAVPLVSLFDSPTRGNLLLLMTKELFNRLPILPVILLGFHADGFRDDARKGRHDVLLDGPFFDNMLRLANVFSSFLLFRTQYQTAEGGGVSSHQSGRCPPTGRAKRTGGSPGCSA